MKKHKRLVWGIIIIVAVVGGAVEVYFASKFIDFTSLLAKVQPLLAQAGLMPPVTNTFVASGFIEAEQVDIAPELGGRVIALYVTEGAEVAAGQSLVHLDDALLEAQIEAAQANVATAAAALAQVKAGARPEQIRQAEIAVTQAEATREGAYQAWQDALAIRNQPQELTLQIVQAQTRVKVAEAALAQATALKDAAAIAEQGFDDAQEAMGEILDAWNQIPESQRPPKPTFDTQLDFHLIPNVYWKAWIGVNTAQAELTAARTALRDLVALRDHPQDLIAQANAAGAQYTATLALEQEAQAQLESLRAGAAQEEIEVFAAQVAQAQAALDTLVSQREKFTVTSPIDGVMLGLSIHTGELAAPGATMLTLGDLEKVKLTVYVSEDRLGQIAIGQTVAVQVDSFPDRAFTGTVVAIADEAEFTPRNVQTQAERVNMVFAVDIEIPNPDQALKPGMPADAQLAPQE
jgi:multidrug efflux pump subunit AcrA (membrane-fusion protein)